MATKPFDLTKFRKSITKAIDNLGVGFNDPTDWISTGNYALNYLISGDFYKGVPLGKVTVFAGESGCLPKSATINIKVGNETKTVTIAELREMYLSGNINIEIDTPDGYQTFGNWYDKGVLKTYTITTTNHSLTCAENHLVQMGNSSWMPTDRLHVGDELITTSGVEVVTSIKANGEEECFDFEINHPNHRYWGDGISSHNSGKSYICAGNIIKNAQEQGIYVILIDSENALDEAWLHKLGVDTTEDKVLKLNMAMIDDVAKTISEFMKEYKSLDEKPKVLFVIDSLGMLLTPTDLNQFEAGDLKGDMGRKPKALAALVRNCVNLFGSYNVGLVATNHSYASQDPYNPDPNISGGQGFIYASSIVVAMKKLKLKEDEEGNKVSEVRGIRSGCKIMKTRYSKPFEDIEVRIPWDTGMDPYSGLFDLLEKKGKFIREGNKYNYIDRNGTEHKYFRKEWLSNTDGAYEKVMEDIMLTPTPNIPVSDAIEYIEDDTITKKEDNNNE